ncbi:MAG: hypothetical protein IJD82_03865 [Clostridia bacterium]|nr:hypothetical protein [Clostridia bacterium]
MFGPDPNADENANIPFAKVTELTEAGAFYYERVKFIRKYYEDTEKRLHAIDKIKDAFSVDADETTFSGVADKLTVERVKLLYVNQYSEGCTILQPVFNLMGTAENDSGTAEFSAKIIAIPEKYTYEDD